MGKVADLAEARFERMPHSRGPARCLHCGHEWQQVAPAGEYDGFTCPECGMDKGMLVSLLAGAPGQGQWRCNCGCPVCRVIIQDPGESEQGVVVCAMCLAQHGWLEPFEE